MRLDKFLKVSRVIKRRTVATEACSKGRVSIGGKVAKPSTAVKLNDIIKVAFGDRAFTFKVIDIADTAKKQDAKLMYEIIEGTDES